MLELVRPAPGLRPGYPGPTHGPGPGSEGVRVRVQKKRQKLKPKVLLPSKKRMNKMQFL